MIVHMIGNAHIDPVWLWTWQAGVDEVMATFTSAVARCEEYPDFIFTRGEAWTYQQVERLDPKLFAKVRSLIERGQWHITGGQWIQPDVNLPTEAGLRRQFIHGRRYFKDRFGIEPDVGYNVDSFGHPATLPDILSDCGYIGYVFHRPNQAQTPVPSCTFRWRGTRGAEVMGFRIPAPYTTRSDDLYGQIMLSLDAADPKLGHVMCFYGVGNHGGGPTKGNIEYILENKNAFAGAELRFSTPQQFFQEIASHRDQLPVVDFELQRTFPGCYVVMQDIKQEQRAGEHLLQQAEQAIVRFADADEKPRLTEKLDSAWEDLLFTEFHDILAGTSIQQAWRSVRAMQGRARINAEEIIAQTTRKWSRDHLPRINHQQIAILNPSCNDFDGFVEHAPFLDFDTWGDRWLATTDGKQIPHQFVQAQSTLMLSPGLVFPVSVKAGEASLIVVRDGPAPSDQSPHAEAALHATTTRLANAQVQIELTLQGIAQIRFKKTNLLGRDGLRLHLREDRADTWGFKIDRFDAPILHRLDGCEWFVEETGPLRARVRTDVILNHSRLRWTLSLYHDRPTIEMELDIDFSERFKILQMPMHLAGDHAKWRSGLAGGAVDREASPIEWPVQAWVYPVSTTASDPTLVSMSHDANSVSFNDQYMTWSLLRATRMAWSGSDASLHTGRDTFTDNGEHHIKFIFQPLQMETPCDAALHQIADTVVQPLVLMDRYEGMNRPPWGNAPPRRLWTPAEVRARKDGRMMHLVDDGTGAVEE